MDDELVKIYSALTFVRAEDVDLKRENANINADTAAVVAASPDKANWDKNLFAYCDNDPVSRKDDGGDLWEEITTLGDSIFRSALIFGGLAIGAAVLSAFVVGTGGAGAIAIPMLI